MNPRIRALAEQAGYQEDMFGIGHWDMPECQRFVELIVRECYEECKSQMLPEGMAESEGYTYNDGVMDCALGLLQHFGVKQ
jgi:hypothetical protein